MAKPLFTLTAGDLMSRDLVLVPRDMSLRGAARLLARAQVTGAPIVNEEGRCIGVLSATDFLRRAGTDSASARPAADESGFCSDWFMNGNIEALPEEEVGKVMTLNPVTVLRTTPLGELTRQMIDAHIHRLVVVDEAGRPIGIVSSMDVLAAVSRAAGPRVQAIPQPTAT